MRWATIALAGAVFAAAIEWGTFAVGGSDSYCYAHQAEEWAHGTLLAPDPLSLTAPWPGAALTFTPVGHVPSKAVPGAVVPMCPAGLPLAMALFQIVGGPRAIFFVVPLFGALLVAAVSVVGNRFSPRVGLGAAVLTASSPAFLFQVVQPMSDVPAAALWVAAVACATGSRRFSPLCAGLASGAAVLVRPNLLPLGFVIGVFLLIRPGQDWRARVNAALWYACGCAPGCLAVGAIQRMLYGSALASGYGELDRLFSASNIIPNLSRYATWMWRTHTPVWLLAWIAPFLLHRWISGLLLALVLANLACYLPYVVFNDWWYLRFLLPTIPLLLVLTAAVIDLVAVRVLDRAQTTHAGARVRIVMAGATTLLALIFIREARAGQVFELLALESRFVRVGTFVDHRLPRNALLISGLDSGSIRYYSGRRTITWDALGSDWLESALQFAREQGFEPYLVLESWEEPLFRSRFAKSETARLDWPPMADIDSKVRIFKPGDRDRYLRGIGYATEYVR